MEDLERLFEDIVDNIEVQDDEQTSKLISRSEVMHEDVDEDANPYTVDIPFNVTKLGNKSLINQLTAAVRHFFESIRVIDSFFIRFHYNMSNVMDLIDKDLFDDFYDISTSTDNSY